MFILTDSQRVQLSFSGKSKAGNDAPVENATLESSDTSVVTVVNNGDGSFLVESTGKVGTAQLHASADSLIGDGEELLHGIEDVEVVAGRAVVLQAQFGTPEEKPQPE